MPTNFTSKLVKIGAGNYRLDIETHCVDDTLKMGFFSPSFHICKDRFGWTANGDRAFFGEFQDKTLKAVVSFIEYKINQLLNPQLLNCSEVKFHRNSGGFLVWETTFTARNGMKYQVYIQRPPQSTANYTARAFLPNGGELQAEGVFAPNHAFINLTKAVEDFHKAQAEALDKIAPTTPVEAPATVLAVSEPAKTKLEASTPDSEPAAISLVDLLWLASDPAPRTDALYGAYRQALNELAVLGLDLTKEGEERWLKALGRSIDLRQQIVAQESRVAA